MTIEATVRVGQQEQPSLTEPSPPGRLLWIDNLRWTMIIMVISMHAADTYSPLGNWYYVDRRPMSHATLLVFAAWQMYLQSFFMGLLFFVAGFFVPGSLERKGPRLFVSERAHRLGLPVLFYMFLLGPITEYFFSHSWNSTEPTSFANEWIKHIRNGQFLQENGPLWFCLALLIFSITFTAFRMVLPLSKCKDVAERLSATKLMSFAVAMAAFSFLIRLAIPSGFSLLNMHLSDFPQYVLLFVAGTVTATRRSLLKISFPSGLLSLLAALTFGLAAWFLILRLGGAFDGNSDAFSSGLHWQNAAFSLWESFSCVATSYALLGIFQNKFKSQGLTARFLSDNAFSVYVFHPPILILCARILHPVAWPALSKFILLMVSGTILTFLLSATVFRRIPLLRRIL